MPTIGMVDSSKSSEKVPNYKTWNPNRAMATTYLFTGPTSGSNGMASTAFTVKLPANQAALDAVVTPQDAGTGTAGVFTPTSMLINDANPSETFTYTPGSTGAKVISVTNNGGLTNPASITYTSS